MAVSRRTLGLAVPFSILSLVAALALPAEPRAVAVPALGILNLAAWFFVVLWNRDGSLPIFEIGTVCVGFTALYTAYPLMAFVLAGGQWTAASDNRLLQWAPDARALGTYAWRPVLYLAAFAVTYLAVRGRATGARVRVRPLSGAGAAALGWLFLLLLAYFAWLWVWFGVTYNPSYTDVETGRVGVARDLPYVLQQLSHNARGILAVLKLCGIAVLMQHWASPRARALLILWLAAEIVATAFRMGARTEIVVLLVATVMLYHRFVRPLQLKIVAPAAVGLLAAALLFGFARDFMRGGQALGDASYWSTANEFQVLMSTGYDLEMRVRTGALGEVPWQVYLADALRVVPSQLLGVPKIEPAEWYLQVLGLRPESIGLMFGVMAQAAIGYGTIELLVRGAVLGFLFALLHRFYARRAASFWVSMLYLYVCLWSYYTVRASTFYFVYMTVYQFLPTMAFVLVAAALATRAARMPTRMQRSEGAA